MFGAGPWTQDSQSLLVLLLWGQRLLGPVWLSKDLKAHFHCSIPVPPPAPNAPVRTAEQEQGEGWDLPELVLTLCVTWNKTWHLSEPHFLTNGRYLSSCCGDQLMTSKTLRPRSPPRSHRELERMETREQPCVGPSHTHPCPRSAHPDTITSVSQPEQTPLT